MPLHSMPVAWHGVRDRVGASALHFTQEVIDAAFPEIAIAESATAVDGYAVTVTVQLTRVPGPALAATPPIPYTPPPGPTPAHESFLIDMRAIQAARIHLHNTWAARKPSRWLAREQPTEGLTGRDLDRAEMRNAVIRAIADTNWLYDNDPDRQLE